MPIFKADKQPVFIGMGKIMVTNSRFFGLALYSVALGFFLQGVSHAQATNLADINSTSMASQIVLPAGVYPRGTAIVDIDGDDKLDLIVANVGTWDLGTDGTIMVYRNVSTNGTLTGSSFATPVIFSTGGWPVHLYVGDIDGDGKPDVVVPSGGNCISIFRNQSTPGVFNTNSFAPKVDIVTGNMPFGVAIGDLDADGRVDLAVANCGDNTVSVLRNIGSPGSITTNSFAAKIDFPANINPNHILTSDVDGDGKLDLVVAGQGLVSILRNTTGTVSSNSFSPSVNFSFDGNADGLAVGDLDGDGKPDVVVSTYVGRVLSVFRNISTVGEITTNSLDAKLDLQAGGSTHDVAIVDLNRDGKPDLVTSSEYANTISIFQNRSSKGMLSFGNRVDFSTGENPAGIAVGDLNGDGKLDLTVANFYNNTVSIYQNTMAVIPVPAPSGLVAWWQAEGNGIDIVGGNNAVAQGNVAFAPGEVGQAFSFSGDAGSSWMQVADAPIFHFTNAMTVEAWVNLKSFSGANSREILSKIGGPNFNQASYTFAINPSNNKAYFVVATTNGASGIVYSSTSIPLNQWVHLVGTYDGKEVQIYVNGKLDGSTPWTLGIFPGANPLVIGCTLQDYSHPTSFFNGLIDEVSLYNRALAPNEINGVYQSGILGKAAIPPSIIAQAQSQTAVVGTNITLSVIAAGSQPLGYQWLRNSNVIAGATNSSLILNNVQLGDSGLYSVVVTNQCGLVTSSNAQLTVTAPPIISAPSGLVAWWRGEGDTRDSVGTNDGVARGNLTFTSGAVGQAFNLDGNTCILVPDAPSLNPTNAITIEAWVMASRYSDTDAVTIIGKGGGYEVDRQYQLVLDHRSGQWRFANYLWFKNGLVGVQGSTTVNLGVWYHLAMTYDGSVLKLFVNGSLDGTLAVSGPIPTGSNQLSIGGEPQSEIWDFPGLIDELALYNRALSDSEIQSIYNAGSSGKSVTIPPSIVAQPQSQSASVGSDVTLSVSATGAQPMSYEWLCNLSTIPGATNASLTLTNVQLGASGLYSVMVTNQYGSVTSSNAQLTVTAPPVVFAPSGLVSWWRAEGDTKDSVGTNDGVAQGNVTFVPGEVGQAFSFDGSTCISVPDAPSLNPTNAITLEAWVLPTRFANNDAVGIIQKGAGYEINRQYQLLLDHRTGQWRFADILYTKNGPVSVAGSTIVSLGVWYHLAMTYDGSVLKLYVNGNLDGSVAVSGPIPTSSNKLSIGGDVTSTIWDFPGLVDEASLYNRALTGSEIQALYDAGSAGKSVTIPPSIVAQPQSQSASVGTNVTLSVSATGAQPLSYQWLRNLSSISGATNASLTLSNVQLGASGSYSVVVTNPYGSVTSSNALLMVTAPPITPPPSGLLSLTNGLVAYFPFNGNANDLSGNGNNGTLNGSSSYSADRFSDSNHALSFAATTDIVCTSSNISNPEVFSTCVWFATTSTNQGALVGFDDGQCSHGYNWDRYTWLNANGNLVFYVYSGSAYCTTTGKYNDGLWHQVVSTLSSNGMQIYVDGVLSAQNTSVTQSYPYSGYWRVGGLDMTGGLPAVIGRIDDVRIYNRALSVAEVQQLYSYEVVPPPSTNGLVAYYPFNGNANDLSGNENNGTNIGGRFVLDRYGLSNSAINFSNINVVNPQMSNCLRADIPVRALPTIAGTISAWINPSDISHGAILGRCHPFTDGACFTFGGTEQYQDGWPVSGTPGRLYFNSSIWRVNAASTNLITQGLWQQVTVTYTPTECSFYINGCPAGTTAGNYSIPDDLADWNPTTCCLGAFLSDATDRGAQLWTDGSIDDIRIYNRALSASEVSQLYQYESALSGSVAPSIVLQPQAQTINIGTNAKLTVSATGTEPISYQWMRNSSVVLGATNASLTLSNVQLAASGLYSVRVTNPYGLVTSSNAQLTVVVSAPSGLVSWWRAEGDTKDSVGTNDGVAQGNVTFVPGEVGQAFSFDGSTCISVPDAPSLNPTNAITLEAWVLPTRFANNDAVGIIQKGAGYEINRQYQLLLDHRSGQWRFADILYTKNPVSVTGSTIVSLGVWYHLAMTYDGSVLKLYVNGNLDGSVAASGPIPTSSNKLSIGGDVTSTIWDFPGLVDEASLYNRALTGSEIQAIYDAGSTGKSVTIPPSIVAQPQSQNASVGSNVTMSVSATGAQPLSYQWLRNSSVIVGATNSSLTLSNVQTGASGLYSVKVTNPNGSVTSSNAVLTVCDLARIVTQPQSRSAMPGSTVLFNVAASGSSLSYQWYYNGVSIPNATSASLLLPHVQIAQSGNYSVTVRNPVSSVNSSNAVLFVGYPVPSITAQPQSQSALIGANVNLSVSATGTGTLSYQWTLGGVMISGATKPTLTLSNFQLANAGNYQVIVANQYGGTTSAVAVVSVRNSILQVGNQNATGGSFVDVPVRLVGAGTENVTSFSLGFDPSVLSFISISNAAADPRVIALFNTNQAAIGKLAATIGQADMLASFNAGTQQLAVIRFQVATIFTNATTTVAFSGSPVAVRVLDTNGVALPLLTLDGSVAVTPGQYEGDVFPGNNLDHIVDINDWRQIGRFVAGLDTPSTPEEFQRADCAPISTLGDGKLTVADWVQAGRYAVGLDPLVPVGGPTSNQQLFAKMQAAAPLVSSRAVNIMPLAVNGRTNSFLIQLTAQGDESAMGFSLSFDPGALKFVGASLADGASGAYLNLNSKAAASGSLGFLLGYPSGCFQPGSQQMVRVDFVNKSYVSKQTTIAFANSPVALELADSRANVLSAATSSAVEVTLPPLPRPELNISNQVTQVVVKWPLEAEGFVLESADSVGNNWTSVQAPVQTNDPNVQVVLPPSTGARFFRLNLK